MANNENSKGEQIKFLDEERRKLWDRVVSLEKSISDLRVELGKKASDSEKEAAQSSKKAAEYRNRAEARLEEIQQLIESINRINESHSAVVEEIKSDKATSVQVLTELETTKAEYQEQLTILETRIEKLDAAFERYPDFDNEIDRIAEFISTIEEDSSKAEVSLSAINSKKKEIDTLYRSIFGYVQKDSETGEEIIIEGLKTKLENSYLELNQNSEDLKAEIQAISDQYKAKFQEFEKGFKTKYDTIVSTIKGLLPGAMTTGLSAAYSNKKLDELENLKTNRSNFLWGIIVLGIISIFPIITNILVSLKINDIEVILNRIPKIVAAFLPLYLPALWYTISANKKVNLSKRLIEEYTHKEVLSKTFEGLSKQIENIDDEKVSEELRIRLLINILQVSAENPGKLISNYQGTDHPVMEALEQSYKFQLALDKLEGIPGIGKIAAIIETKKKNKLDKKEKKIDQAFSSKSDSVEEEA